MARAKTDPLPGMDNGKVIQEVSDAAERYEKARDARMKLTQKETEAQQALVALMLKHKLALYRDDNYDPPLIVEWKHADKAMVRREKGASG